MNWGMLQKDRNRKGGANLPVVKISAICVGRERDKLNKVVYKYEVVTDFSKSSDYPQFSDVSWMESLQRSLSLYSKEADFIFCFCCKLKC
jgi:hypothetical protein